jgi:hypothetical protein
MPVRARVERNEGRFAAANDSIALLAGRLGPRPLVPFLCECPDPRCSVIAELSLGEYAALRLFANRYVVSSLCRGAELPGTLIVESTDRFTVVDRL